MLMVAHGQSTCRAVVMDKSLHAAVTYIVCVTELNLLSTILQKHGHMESCTVT